MKNSIIEVLTEAWNRLDSEIFKESYLYYYDGEFRVVSESIGVALDDIYDVDDFEAFADYVIEDCFDGRL